MGSFIVLIGFSLVANGQIHTVPSQGSGTSLMVSSAAVEPLARAGGASVTTDPAAGVISVSTAPGKGIARFSGFKGSRVTFVVDGQIISAQAQVVKGTPYVSPKVLEQVATQLGWKATLDETAGVMAVTRAPAATGASTGGGTGTPRPATGGGTGTPRPATGGGKNDVYADVCSYMDALKEVWDGTEPSMHEKVTMKRLASDFQAALNDDMEADPKDVEVLKDGLKSFGAKVDRRIAGTRRLTPPPAASGVKTLGLSFLGKVKEVLTTGTWMTKQMNTKKPDATKEEMNKAIENLQNLDTDIQKIGGQFNREVIRVRAGHGCGPP